ncbi:MAG: histidine phosphatase family protein [Bacteroidales bacterium]
MQESKKTLYLVRHAKSSWKNPDIPDIQRPLLEKGKKRTKQMIDYLYEQQAQMDMIISSHAARAVATAKILAHAFQHPLAEMIIAKTIYEGNEQSTANLFFDLGSDIRHLWIVGHNPTITNFANQFLDQKIDYLQTSGVVCINFEMDHWEQLLTAKRSMNFVMYPKKLKSLKKA